MMNHEFFDVLYAFCASIGRVTLAAGRIESDLLAYLSLRGCPARSDQAGLGSLIAQLKQNGFITENGVAVLREVKTQRNYLTHSLFHLFAGRVATTLLPSANLVPLDVRAFEDKARSLEENLVGLARIVEREMDELRSPKDFEERSLIFRP